MPDDDVAKASKIAHIFVVVVDCLYTACMGKQNTLFARSSGCTTYHVISKYSCMTVDESILALEGVLE